MNLSTPAVLPPELPLPQFPQPELPQPVFPQPVPPSPRACRPVHRRRRWRQQVLRGFVLTELLLGIAIVAVLGLIGAGIYQNLRGGIQADDMADKAIAMVADIQRHWRNAGSYATLSGQELGKLALVRSPLRYDGSTLQDAWGNTMSLGGSTASFALTVGGTSSPLDRDVCATLASRLSAVASAVNIGQAASVSAGVVSGGNVYKSGAAITQASLSAGCSETNPVVAAQFR